MVKEGSRGSSWGESWQKAKAEVLQILSASAFLVKPKEELAALAANLAQIGQARHEIQSVVDGGRVLSPIPDLLSLSHDSLRDSHTIKITSCTFWARVSDGHLFTIVAI
jgi:hypothetical protein